MAKRTTTIHPRLAIPGAEIEIRTAANSAVPGEAACLIEGKQARVIASSSKRILAQVPEEIAGRVGVEAGAGDASTAYISIGEAIASTMHIVANPAIDPTDGAVILTRSGSRGFQLPNTLYRLEPDGYLDELPVEVMNPTGIAFSPTGELFVSNRAAGEVYTIERGEEAIPYVTGLGVATGLAFDKDGTLYVGDRSGTIYKVPELGLAEKFA